MPKPFKVHLTKESGDWEIAERGGFASDENWLRGYYMCVAGGDVRRGAALSEYARARGFIDLPLGAQARMGLGEQ